MQFIHCKSSVVTKWSWTLCARTKIPFTNIAKSQKTPHSKQCLKNCKKVSYVCLLYRQRKGTQDNNAMKSKVDLQTVKMSKLKGGSFRLRLTCHITTWGNCQGWWRDIWLSASVDRSDLQGCVWKSIGISIKHRYRPKN